ncbi:MAG: 50S ribosomal protein L10 [Planctomycetes bacterium]|nr:50S ribosomal protein L10 [Planctomycetota bacterium]
MSKPVKNMITQELRSRYSELNSALWLEVVGVDGVATNQLRRELRAKEMRLEVVKNSLFRRAIGDGPLKPLAEALGGPAAIITGGESLIDVAKLLDEWLPKAKGIKLKGAVLEGEWLDEARVAGLSKMPTKRDLQAKVAAIILSPAANVAAAVNASGGKLAGAIKAMIEKLESAEEIKAKSA